MTTRNEEVIIFQLRRFDAINIVQTLCNEFRSIYGIIPDLLAINVNLQISIESRLVKSSSNPLPVPSHLIHWYFYNDHVETYMPEWVIVSHSRNPMLKVSL